MTDSLERLFRVLVRRVRDVRPENLSRPFEVADILRTFVPYRQHRADVGVETAEDYEVLILRLVSGERGFVFSDDVMQDDLRRELDSGNPDLQALRAYGTAKVTLAQHAMRQVLETSPAAPAAERTAAPAAALETAAHSPAREPHPAASNTVLRDSEGRIVATVAAEQSTGSSHVAATAASTLTAPASAPLHSPAAPPLAALEALQRQLPPTLAELGEAIGSAGDAKTRASFQARASRIPDPTADSTVRTPRPGCRFCGQALPEAREVTFCPHCGQNLKVRRCPGCSAEMDPAWKFCVTCGRAANG